MYFWSIQNRRYQSRGVSWLLPLGEDSDRQRRQAVDALSSGSWQFLHDLECLFAAPDAARASRRARRGCSTHRWGCHEASDGCHRTIWTEQVLVVCMPASPLVRAALPRAVGNGKIWPRVRLHAWVVSRYMLNHCSVLCAPPTMQYLSCICNDLGPSQRLMFNVPPQSAATASVAMRGALGSAHDFLRLVARLACSGRIKASPAEYMYFVQGPPEDFLTSGTSVKYTWSIKVCLDFPYTFLTKSDPSLYRPESVRNILNKVGPVMCHGS